MNFGLHLKVMFWGLFSGIRPYSHTSMFYLEWLVFFPLKSLSKHWAVFTQCMLLSPKLITNLDAIPFHQIHSTFYNTPLFHKLLEMRSFPPSAKGKQQMFYSRLKIFLVLIWCLNCKLLAWPLRDDIMIRNYCYEVFMFGQLGNVAPHSRLLSIVCTVLTDFTKHTQNQ